MHGGIPRLPPSARPDAPDQIEWRDGCSTRCFARPLWCGPLRPGVRSRDGPQADAEHHRRRMVRPGGGASHHTTHCTAAVGAFHSTCSGRQARPVPSSVHWPAPVHRLAAVIGDVGQPRLNVVHTAHSTGHGTEVYCSHTQFTVHHGRSRATHCQLSINFHMQYERQDVTTPSTSPGPSPSPLALGRVRHTGALHPARRTPAHSSSAGGGMSLELDYCTRHYIPLSWAA